MKHEIFDSMKGQMNPSLQAQDDLRQALSKPAKARATDSRRWTALAACAALVIAAGSAFSHLRGGPFQPDPPVAVATPTPVPTSQPSGEPLQPPDEWEITIHWDNVVVNEADGLAPDATRLYRDPELYEETVFDLEGVRDYYGWSLAPAYVPDGLTGGGHGPYGSLFRDRATGEVIEDQAGRGFWVDFWEDGSPKSDDDIVIPKGFTITASRLGILHCCLLPVDQAYTTDFCGTAVTLSHASLPYGPFDPEKMDPSGLYHLPAGYYDIYVASFTLDGVEYEIQADRLELEELIKITASAICGRSGLPASFTVG